jgi:hypothetical protein
MVSGEIKLARIIVRDDNGKHVGYDGETRFVSIDSFWYPVDWIKSIPGLRASDLSFRDTE